MWTAELWRDRKGQTLKHPPAGMRQKIDPPRPAAEFGRSGKFTSQKERETKVRAFQGKESWKNYCLKHLGSRFWCSDIGYSPHSGRHPNLCCCWERNLGIPLAIVLLGDWLRKQLSTPSREWHRCLLTPIQIGADLQEVSSSFVASLLDLPEGVIQYARTDAQRRIIQDLTVMHGQGTEWCTRGARAATQEARREINLAEQAFLQANRFWIDAPPRSGRKAWINRCKAHAALWALKAACSPRGWDNGYAREAADNALRCTVSGFLAANYDTTVPDRNRATRELEKAVVQQQAQTLLALLSKAPPAQGENNIDSCL